MTETILHYTNWCSFAGSRVRPQSERPRQPLAETSKISLTGGGYMIDGAFWAVDSREVDRNLSVKCSVETDMQAVKYMLLIYNK